MSVAPSTSNAAMTNRSFLPAALLLAAGAIIGSLATSGGADAWHWLHWLCKPLATLLILLSAWRTVRPVSAAYRRYVVLAMAWCLLGDVLLMVPGDWFVPGLVSFLLAHALFVAAFSSDVRLLARGWPWLLCLAIGAGMLALLWPGMAPALHVPVVVYVGVLASMAGQALGRALWLRERGDVRAHSARYAALGALLFMLSDSLLAWDRFRAALPWAALYILATYYAALWLIARSVERGVALSRGSPS
jgi:uncharacterized membrane protein YhhN